MEKMDEEILDEALRRADAPDWLVAAEKAPPPPPLEAMRDLVGFFADADSVEEVKRDLRRRAANNPRGLIQGLNGIEAVLANPPAEEGVLSDIVAWEANWVLDDPSDEGAKQWLREVAEWVREALGDKAPPRLN